MPVRASTILFRCFVNLLFDEILLLLLMAYAPSASAHSRTIQKCQPRSPTDWFTRLVLKFADLAGPGRGPMLLTLVVVSHAVTISCHYALFLRVRSFLTSDFSRECGQTTKFD